MAIGEDACLLWNSDIPSRHSQLLWSSETSQIATVDRTGYVNAKGMGKTILNGEYSSMKWSVEVEVLQKILYGSEGGFLDYTEPHLQPEVDFKELIIYNKPWDNWIYEGQTFVIGAMPYPFDMWGDGVSRGNLPNYALHWDSSNEEVARIRNGIIQPLKEGTTLISVSREGSDLTDSFELSVKCKPEEKEYFMKPHEDAFHGLSSKETMQKICDLITVAKREGYNGILFPRRDYHIQPFGLSAFVLPSKFTVDFNYSNLYMDPWHDYVNGTYGDGTQNRHYVLFSFEDAEYSVIRNMNYYGERYDTTHTEAEYGEQTLFLYTSNGYYCELYNCYFEGVAGFHIGIGGEEISSASYLYKYANKVSYKNLSTGFLKEDGDVDISRSSFIYTPEYISISQEDFSRLGMYHMGTSYSARFGSLFNYTRFYNIAWYDENYKLLEYREKEMVYYDYKLPESAAYYKITMWRPDYLGLPLKNDDPRMANAPYSGVAMITPARPTYCCSIYNCEWKNTASGAASGVGDSIGFRFYNNNLNGRESVGKRNAWCYDFEDGWWGMFGNIYQNNSEAFRVAFAGVLNTVIDSGANTECYCRMMQDGKFFAESYGAFYNDDTLNGITNYAWEPKHTGYGYVCGNINIVHEGEE